MIETSFCIATAYQIADGDMESSGSSSRSAAKPGEIPGNHQVALDNQQLKAIATLLAFYLGPIASRLVHKARAENGDRKACVAALAQHIPKPEERAEFFARAQEIWLHSPGRVAGLQAPR